MARDRKRAKQRQRRRGAERPPARVVDRSRLQASGTAAEDAVEDQPPPSPLDARHDDPREAPPPLEESSAEVELAEAAMADPPRADLDPDELPAPQDDTDFEQDDEAAEPVGMAAARAAATPERASGGELPAEGNRFVNFLRACAAELRRVQWPDRRQVGQATGVVLGFVIIAGAYLGVLDAIFSRLVNLIL